MGDLRPGRARPGSETSAFSLFCVGHEIMSAGSWGTINRVTLGQVRELQPLAFSLQPFFVGHDVRSAGSRGPSPARPGCARKLGLVGPPLQPAP